MKLRNNPGLSQEFLIERTAGGVKLSTPLESATSVLQTQKTVAEMMALPFNVYFMDAESHLLSMNEIAVDTCGWDSLKQSLGKSVRDLWPARYANHALSNDKSVLQTQQLQIIEEFAFHGDAPDVQALSFKFPWFNHDNTVLGIFGCSLILSGHPEYSLSTGLMTLINYGLLSPQMLTQSTSHVVPTDTYFSRRERDVLTLLVRGKTAKEAGRLLGLSYRTVEHYIENIKHKLGVTSRSELIDRVRGDFK